MTVKEFPLVLPRSMMTAAKAITEADTMRFDKPKSINETLVQLVGRGLRGMLAQTELSENVVRRGQQPLREILEFLEAHPLADRACAADFDHGSKARAFIEHELRGCHDDSRDATDIPDGIERSEIARQFGQGERSIIQLGIAVDALKRAVHAS